MDDPLESAGPLPLADLHRRLGGRLCDVGSDWGLAAATGVEAVADYGDVDAEHRALRQAAGLLDRSWVGRLELTGADRHRFLNGLVTCEVQELPPGSGAYGFATSVKGRILADLAVVALADRLWLELPPGGDAAFGEHLGKYKVADRVEIAPLAGTVPLTVAGPRAAEVLAAAGGLELPGEPWAHVRGELAGAEAVIVRQGNLGAEAFTLWIEVGEAAGVVERLLAAGRTAGLVPVGVRAAEIVRAEAGIPRFGRDFGADHFPQETGLEEAVSYTKGCYLGQEVVARIHYRGGVNRSLCGLALADLPGGELPRPGTPLRVEGREAGALTTAVHSPALDAAIGLAILPHRAATPGAVLDIEGGGHAEVTTLPFLR